MGLWLWGMIYIYMSESKILVQLGLGASNGFMWEEWVRVGCGRRFGAGVY